MKFRKCKINIKKEQHIIFKKKLPLFSILGIALVLGIVSIRHEFRIGMCLSFILLACTLVYTLKMRKSLNSIEKEFRKSYRDVFCSVKEPSHYEISSYLEANNFSFIEKNDMIYALKYYKIESILYNKDHVLSMTFLFENDNLKENKPLLFKGYPSSIERKYSDEMNEFVKKFNKNLNIENKYVSSVLMRLTIINKAITEIIKDDATHISLVYNKSENTLYYPSYIKEFNFIPTNIPYVEIDKCITKLFDLKP